MSGISEDAALAAVSAISSRARELGLTVRMHVRSVDGGGELGIEQSTPVVAASVFKIAVALELARQSAANVVDLAEYVEVRPAEVTPSPNGLATFSHPVRVSIHDLATQMMAVSDNAATDIIYAKVGRTAIAELLRDLELSDTAVPQDCADILRSIAEDIGSEYSDDEQALASLPYDQVSRLRALNPAATCRTTPEQITRLLAAIWRNEAATAAACGLVRHWMSFQAWGHRIASGFGDGVEVFGKTGTLPGIRNEAGVVVFPDGARYAVGVFTSARDYRARVPERDAFLGYAAAQAVRYLRDQ